MSLEFHAKTKRGDFVLDASFASEGRLTALFGPSGAGKTTIINIIAGLLRPATGRVIVDGTVLLDTGKGISVPSWQRRLGYVFQEGRLFPHLSVRHNLAYGRFFAPEEPRYASFNEVVDLLDLQAFLRRGINELSGGEKQRVALGRALLASPSLLLMDEPLSFLDEARKQEVFPYLERLRDHSKVPMLYVSHSVEEVTRLAKTVVLMAKGSILAVGPTAETLRQAGLKLPRRRSAKA